MGEVIKNIDDEEQGDDNSEARVLLEPDRRTGGANIIHDELSPVLRHDRTH